MRYLVLVKYFKVQLFWILATIPLWTFFVPKAPIWCQVILHFLQKIFCSIWWFFLGEYQIWLLREKSSIKCLGEMKKILQFLTLFTIFKRLTTFGAKNGLHTIIKYSANVLGFPKLPLFSDFISHSLSLKLCTGTSISQSWEFFLFVSTLLESTRFSTFEVVLYVYF